MTLFGGKILKYCGVMMAVILLTGCAQLTRNLELANKAPYAVPLMSRAGRLASKLEKLLPAVRQCYLGLSEKNSNTLEFEGDAIIEYGYMSFKTFRIKGYDIANEAIMKCNAILLNEPKSDEAHGLRLTPSLLTKDHILKFSGILLPVIKGKVSPAEFPEEERKF